MSSGTTEKEKEALKGGEFLLKQTSCADIFTPEDFTDEHRQIAETCEKFVLDEVVPRMDLVESMDLDTVKELMAKAGELGLLMIDAPEEFGGLALDKVTNMLASEKMSGAGSFTVVYSAHTGLGTLPLVYYGTKAQKEKYLEKIISGEWVGAYALTEPESGSDALAAKTTATLSQDGKHYILNGTKQFITNAGFAELITVFAKVDKEHFTAFLVERGYPGVSLGPEEKKMGIKGSSTRQVILDNAQVPVENLLGEVGKGHKIAFNILNMGRFKLGAATLGAAKQIIGVAAKYAAERKQFGKTIGSFGAIKEKLADMVSDAFMSEALVYRLAGMVDQRIATLDHSAEDYYVHYQKCIEEHAIECGVAKVFCSEALAAAVDQAVQIHGGYGFIAEYAVEKAYRDERINRIWEGTNEINRLLIPGLILRRSLKGELPLQSEAMKAFEGLMSPSMEEIDETRLYAKEKALIANLKTAFLIVAGAAAQKYMEKLGDEQEILMAAADMAIQTFALESAVLRAEKIHARSSDNKKKLLDAVVKAAAFSASEKHGSAARKAAFFAEEGDVQTMLLSGIRRNTRYDATGLLEAKRTLADTTLEQGKYIF
ncbi:MAG: acyl-CoA dehydrogenase family protein [Nitrospinota bacterium]|nr:acyl-CoA dehydrogenase family protein [Nitrospinota bacterium]